MQVAPPQHGVAPAGDGAGCAGSAVAAGAPPSLAVAAAESIVDAAAAAHNAVAVVDEDEGEDGQSFSGRSATEEPGFAHNALAVAHEEAAAAETAAALEDGAGTRPGGGRSLGAWEALEADTAAVLTHTQILLCRFQGLCPLYSRPVLQCRHLLLPSSHQHPS